MCLSLVVTSCLTQACAYTRYSFDKPAVPLGRTVEVENADGDVVAIRRGKVTPAGQPEMPLKDFLRVEPGERDPIQEIVAEETNFCGALGVPPGAIVGLYTGVFVGGALTGCGDIADGSCSGKVLGIHALAGAIAGAYFGARAGAQLCASND
ncbi:MAG: hypothetical protein AAFQ82_02430, partial [Myxococcota bacterium]